ncbi:hypothetical protein Lalb_Chr25g0286021 [Lupinus albus]|uniref:SPOROCYTELESS-like EAR-containing protein n=1 Tax=Lupinus albus TaxID=3870 RepID=A0A6A4MLZ0_LUPAL|nr:hypothetical protein Lalb_Chr25g0286021 [Lupinus albus]
MAQEDQTQNHSNSGSGDGGGGGGGGGGRSSRKTKQKKVPQRGLGVAQLEKIILEEQQKTNAASILPPSFSVSSTKPSHMPLPIQNFHPSQPDFMTHLSLQHTDSKVPSTIQLGNSGSGGSEGNWPNVSVLSRHGNVPKLSFNEFDFEKEGFGVDPGLPFLPYLPYESNSNNSNWPLPNLMQRTTQNPQSASTMVNVSPGTSSTIPMPHFSIEPPSNQNYSGSGVPMRPPEKMIGMKRQHPFSMDFPPLPPFNYKMPTSADMRTNGTISCGNGNGNGFNFDAGNSALREVQSCSASNSEPRSKKSNKESENFNGNFLTLAPPSPTSCPPSKLKSSPTFLPFHNHQYPQFQSPSYQGNVEDEIPDPQVQSRFNEEEQHLYSFLPPATKEAQIGQTTTATVQNCNDIIDLNLKL